jgi:uncharacterized protein (TIGR01619 family)
MNLIQRYLIALFLLSGLYSNSQQIRQDWENYVLPIGTKPVSINVDLGFGSVAPLKERGYVIIVRTKIINPDTRGMPYPEEDLTLLNMEDTLLLKLSNATGSLFVGRFTQRGIREFYFYAPDTVGYEMELKKSMNNFPSYEWLAKGKEDPSWENYFTVLYPPAMELLKIKSKRQIDYLEKTGQHNSSTLPIIHILEFSEKNNREKFLRNLPFQGFEILSMPATQDGNSGKFMLVLKRNAEIVEGWVDQFIIPLANAVQSNGGKYIQWSVDTQ